MPPPATRRPSPAGETPTVQAERTGWPSVTVIMPVLNEERHLAAAVHRALGQDYPGTIDLVLALGPSHDGTDAIAGQLAAGDPRIRLVPNPSGHTPAGLNAALALAHSDVIVRLDGHALIDRDYVRVAVEVLQATGADNVGGIMAAEGSDPFSCAVARAMRSPIGVGSAAFHVGGTAGPADSVYLGVFRRPVLDRLGGYDERFQRAQDWELNYRIRRGGGLVWFTPALQVTYRPRSTLRALAAQYYHYGRWRRVLVRQYPQTATPRYLAPPVMLLGVTGGSALALLGWRPGLAAPVGYVLLLLASAAWTGRGLPVRGWVQLPAIFATMHWCWAVGFLTSPIRLAVRPPAVSNRGVGEPA